VAKAPLYSDFVGGPALSVVVPTRDRPELLAGCLDALASALRPGDELIVADSSSAHETVAALVAAHGGVALRCTTPGASRQRNAGAAHASHALIAFVDDDVRVDPGWASAFAELFAADDDTDFATGRVDVPPEQSGYSRPVAVKTDREPSVLTAASDGTVGHSANMAIRREAFRRVGGFDERMGPGTRFPAAEDNDLFDRLFAAGCVGRYEPSALAFHDQWRSRRQLVRLEWLYGVGMGARLARLMRSDRRRASAALKADLWANGIKLIPTLLRDRYEFGVLFVVVRAVGTTTGFFGAIATSKPWSRRRADKGSE
jgi:GT2 family glycosyltransferase